MDAVALGRAVAGTMPGPPPGRARQALGTGQDCRVTDP